MVRRAKSQLEGSAEGNFMLSGRTVVLGGDSTRTGLGGGRDKLKSVGGLPAREVIDNPEQASPATLDPHQTFRAAPRRLW